jgi:hypothetical protein
MNPIVAQIVIFGQRPGGQRFQITVRIRTPYQVSGEHEEWACPVSLEPLYANLRDIHGGDSFQALCLAVRLVHQLLKGFVEDGGSLTYETGEEFPLDSYGIASTNPGSSPR